MNIRVVLISLMLSSCSMYEVVQELGDNQYHLYNKKKGKVEIIHSNDKLEVGKTYNLKKVKNEK